MPVYLCLPVKLPAKGGKEILKTMRYRIRVITLLLISALTILLIVCIRTIWFPAGSGPFPSETPLEDEIRETDDYLLSTPSSEPSVSPDPLYDTYGL